MGDSVQIFEVSPRDGLQNEAAVLSTDEKLAHIRRLVAAGVQDVEVTSFVRASRIPQLADAEAVYSGLRAAAADRSEVGAAPRFWALVPNQIGLDRALSVGVTHICTFLSASETHNHKNVNRSVRESIAGLRRVIGTAIDEGVAVRAYISTVFGCPYEGHVPVQRTVDIAKAMLGAGASVVVLGDTTGMGVPDQVKRTVDAVAAAGVPLERLALHAHDTRGTALVNAYAAFEAGVRRFDGSVAGIGGCPYAPGAAGNAATEDLVHMFEGMGVSTGIDPDALASSGHAMAAALGRELPGRMHQFTRSACAAERQTA